MFRNLRSCCWQSILRRLVCSLWRSLCEWQISIGWRLPRTKELQWVLCANEVPSQVNAIKDSFSLLFGEVAGALLNSLEELLDAYRCCPGLDYLIQLLPTLL